jgi:hypothetical protein
VAWGPGPGCRAHGFDPEPVLNSRPPPSNPESPGTEKMAIKRTSKWGNLGERVAKLKDGESIVLECETDPTEEARKIRSGLNGIRRVLIRYSVRIVAGKIVITHVGAWPMLSAFKVR